MNGNQKKITNLFELDVSNLHATNLVVDATNAGLNITNLPLFNSPLPYWRFPFANTNTGSNGAIRYDDLEAALAAQINPSFPWLIVTNGSSTPTIQSQMNSLTSGGVLAFQPGTYTITAPIIITNPMLILGDGATLSYSAGLTNFMLDTGTNYGKTLLIDNLNFDGGVISHYNDTNHFQTITPGQHWPWINPCWTNRSGLRVETSKGVRVQNCTFYGWPGNACLALSIGGTLTAQGMPKFEFLFNRCYTNFIGCFAVVAPWDVPGYYQSDSSLWISSAAPEYCLIQGNDVFENQYGLLISAGNALVHGNTINENWMGLVAFSGVNCMHGNYTGNTLNHNILAIYFEGGGLGGLFQDNVILATGRVIFNSVDKVVLKNNSLGQSGIIMTNGTTGVVENNGYDFGAIWGSTNDLTGFYTNINPKVLVYGNNSDDGTNNDGTTMSIVGKENALATPSNMPPAHANSFGEMFFWNSNAANLYLLKTGAGTTNWATTNLIN